jgi:phosphoribosylaminoimidazole-succinocarboxamide synthase
MMGMIDQSTAIHVLVDDMLFFGGNQDKARAALHQTRLIQSLGCLGTNGAPSRAAEPSSEHKPPDMNLTTLDLPGIPKVRSGKVREVFDLGADGFLLAATDRLSAFDCVFSEPIPHKGAVLTRISAFWFEHMRQRGIVADHFLSADFSQFPAALRPFKAELSGRSTLVRRARPLPVECIVRGYLAGSGWKEYQADGAICGQPLPGGLRLADPLPEPIFTPATKAESGHDENIAWEEFRARLNDAALAEKLRAASLALYRAGAAHAAERGILIADTKFEFGLDEQSGELLLIDECLTPDSSRFWPADQYRPGISPPSFDKQYVRDYLETLAWDKTPPAPALPAEVIARTSEKYLHAFEAITGRVFAPV